MSPLYLAILNNNIECAEFLVYNEATVYYDDDAQSKDTSPIFLAIRMKAKDILEQICDLNPEVNAKDSRGLTPLMFAAKNKHEEVVQILANGKSINLDEEDTNKMTILMHFLLEGNVKNARKLINRGANINYVNSNGQTALHICILHKKIEAIDWLIKQKKIDRHIMNLEGKDCCDLACEREEILNRF